MPEVKLHRKPKRWPVVAIGIYKFVKVVLLVAAFIFLRSLFSDESRAMYGDLVELAPHKWINDLLSKLLALHHNQLVWLRVGVIVYAALYLIEGLGLLWDRKWAEWMVVITTAGFMPFEIYEIVEQLTWVRVLALVVNAIMVGYLVFRLKRMHTVKKEEAGMKMRGPEHTAPVTTRDA